VGAPRVVMTSKFPLRDAHGNITGLGGVATDITERKRAEQELQASLGQLRALADHLQTIREDERATLAREIHDEFGSALTGLKMDLASMERKLLRSDRSAEIGDLAEKMRAMSARLDEQIRKLRTVATELRPSVLDLGLGSAIEWQAKEFQSRTGIRCQVELDRSAANLDRQRATAVFRIFQEILTNVARHAKATRVTGALKVKGDRLVLEVRDNGVGINPKKVGAAKSLGLLGMRERALLLDGTLEVRGKLGRGTSVALRIPIRFGDAPGGAGGRRRRESAAVPPTSVTGAAKNGDKRR
jgi:signal transduction histidine kinase